MPVAKLEKCFISNKVIWPIDRSLQQANDAQNHSKSDRSIDLNGNEESNQPHFVIESAAHGKLCSMLRPYEIHFNFKVSRPEANGRRSTMGYPIFFAGRHAGRSRLCVGIILSILLLGACAREELRVKASQYRFKLEGESYRLRSITSEGESKFYNELIGAEFMAVDFDQDRILDCILLGEASLEDAQAIYEYGLNELSKENKLQLRMPTAKRYLQEGEELRLEIISFRRTNGQPPFNEFKLTGKRQMVSPEINVFVDRNADGTLDEVLKGAMVLESAQAQYTRMIESGLQQQALIKAGGMILVKE